MSYPPSVLGWGKRKRRLPPLLCWEGACGPPAWPLSSTGRCWAGLCWGPCFGRAQLPPRCHPAHPGSGHVLHSPLTSRPWVQSPPAACVGKYLNPALPHGQPQTEVSSLGLTSHPVPSSQPAVFTRDQFVISQEHGRDPGARGKVPQQHVWGQVSLWLPPKGSFLCCKSVVTCTLCNFHPL